MASDIQVQRMINLGVPEDKAASAAVEASNATSGEAFNTVVQSPLIAVLKVL